MLQDKLGNRAIYGRASDGFELRAATVMPAAYIAPLDSVALLLNEDCLSIWLVPKAGCCPSRVTFKVLRRITSPRFSGHASSKRNPGNFAVR